MQKKKFAFAETKDMALESKGANVETLQTLLASLGYLRGCYEPGCICRRTDRAIRHYQRYYKLKVDGIVGPITRTHLEQPRCGVADIPVNLHGGTLSGPYRLVGCSYPRHHLTYTFLNVTSDLAADQQKAVVRQAFSAWAAIADLEFSEVEADESPDFRIAWRAANHGDGYPFDGPGNTLAHAFFPPPCGGSNAGDLHFDDGETWVLDPSASGILLLQVAIHEIGHLLGLSHSQNQSAIMYAYYSATNTQLHQDDLNGVVALYGARPVKETHELTLLAETEADLAKDADETHFTFGAMETATITIDGPADADFDLYIRKGAVPTIDDWDYRAWSASSDEKIVFPVDSGEKYFVMVRSYRGSGHYKLKIVAGVL